MLMSIPRRWHESLAARYGVVMVGFVAVGSLLLLTWLRHQQQDEARRVFLTVAKNDVDFIRRMNLPRSTKLAADLRQLLGLDIHFRLPSGLTQPPLLEGESQTLTADVPAEKVIALPTGRQALILKLDHEHDMIFIRESPAMTLSLWHPETRYALVVFWLFSAVFAWIIGRQVLGPVQRLTRGVKGFFGQSGRGLPETRRADEIGELARALTQARDDLVMERERREQSERLALLGRVATGLAHEIKNPLASIQLHAQLMDSVDLDAESQASLGHLLAEVRVIEGLVNQWLYLARPASPKTQPMDLRPLLKETLEMLRPQAGHADVTLHLLPAGSAVEGPIAGDRMRPRSRARQGVGFPSVEGLIAGDRLRLQQVFRNLILNAIQAMPGGGRLEISLRTEGEAAILAFRDGGRGFSPEALEHGAELFFSEKEGGMGVGLNVVKEIISAHAGKITLKNHPEGGAVVEIALPMIKS